MLVISFLLLKFNTAYKESMKMIKTQMPKKYESIMQFFLMNSPHSSVMFYAPNITETEKIYWYHFVRRTRSLVVGVLRMICGGTMKGV